MADQALIADLRSQIESIESCSGSFDEPFCGRASRSSSSRAKRGISSASGQNGEQGKSGKQARGEDPDKTSPEAALSKIVALVNVSDRSERTIRDRLARAEFAQAAIDKAVERAKTYGFIDDARFAEVLVRSRVSQGKGSAGIERELAGNGIDPSAVPGWPAEYGITPESELDRALALLEARPPRSKNPRDAAYRKLVGKGYPSSTAASAARI